MRGMMQKRIAFLFVVVLLFVALVPAFYPFEDEALLKDTPAYRAYSQLYTAFNIAFDFDCHVGWTRNSSTFGAVWYVPSVFHSSTETRAPPA
jgi:ABC-type uncharacterized transport system permease subunit